MSAEPEGVGDPTPQDDAEPAPVMQTFYVTFGVMYRHTPHPYWEHAHPDGWLEVEAPDETAARELVQAHIGTQYAFMYSEQEFNRPHPQRPNRFPLGMLARISVRGFPPPKRRFHPSSPEWHGRNPREVICARIEGILAEGSDTETVQELGYEARHVHRSCYEDGLALFKEVQDTDFSVLAFELDWTELPDCAVCGRGIP